MNVVAWMLIIAACRRPDPGPALRGWSVRPAGADVPLTFVADIEANESGTATLRWSSGDHEGGASFDIAAGWTRNLPLLGFREGRTYTLSLEFSASGVDIPENSADNEVITPLVSTEGQHVEVVSSEPERMAGGLTMLPLWGGGINAQQAVVLDEEGEIVYLLNADDRFHELLPHGDGLLALVGNDELEIREMDWLGGRKRTFLSAGAMLPGREGIVVDLPGRIHHEVVPLEDGGYIVIATTLATLDLPSSYDDLDDLVPTQIEDDVIARFDASGEIVWSYDVSPMLDQKRIGFDSLSRPRRPDAVAWGHVNAIWMEDDGRIGLSVRHQDEIVLFDPRDGVVDWILGNTANRDPLRDDPLLAPVGDAQYPYHPHGARRMGDALTLFDNGNWRASPGEIPFGALPEATEQRSRLVQYEVDEEAMTFTQIRELDLSASLGEVFCVSLGDMDLLPNGNVLGTFGRIVAQNGIETATLGVGAAESRIVEFDSEGEEVWHLRLSIDGEVDPIGWASWRAERFAAFPGAIE